METIGWSPKVYIPGLIQLGVGVALFVLGIIVPDDTLKALGLGAIGSGLATLGIGHQADPGIVHVDSEFYPDAETGPNPPAK